MIDQFIAYVTQFDPSKNIITVTSTENPRNSTTTHQTHSTKANLSANLSSMISTAERIVLSPTSVGFKQPPRPSIKLILTPIKEPVSQMPPTGDSPVKPSLKRKAESHPAQGRRIALKVVCLSEQKSPLPYTFKLLRPRVPKAKKIGTGSWSPNELDWSSPPLKLFKQIEREYAHLADITERKAYTMMKWSLLTNPRLHDFNICEVLGYGGCGVVLAGSKKKDNQKVLFFILHYFSAHF